MSPAQVYLHRSTGEWMRSGGQLLGGSPPPAGNQPTGPGITRYQDKYVIGDRLSAAMARMTTQAQMSFPADVVQDPDFADSAKFMALIPDVCSGMLGAGVDQTVFQMRPGSSTKVSSVPTSGTNPLYLFRTATNPSAGFTISGMTICGTEQPVDPNTGRPHAYGAFMLDHVNAPIATDVKFVGIPGEGNSPPQETFCGVNDFGCSNGQYTRVETDGRIGVGTGAWYTPSFFAVGTKVSASPFGTNSSANPTLTDCYFHHCRASMLTFWQTNSATTFNVRCEFNGSGAAPLSGHGINHERPSGTYHHWNPTIIIDRAHGNTGLHMSLMGDQGNTDQVYLHGIVPGISFDQTSGTPFRSCFSCQMHAAGALYQGNPTTQTSPPRLSKPDGTAFTVDSGSVPAGADPASEFGVFL